MKSTSSPAAGCIAILILLAPISPAWAASIDWGGFENGTLAPWFQDRDFSPETGEDWSVTLAEAHSGNFSATASGDKELRLSFAPIETAHMLQVALWVKHPTAINAPTVIDLFYADGTSTRSVLFSASLDWEFIDVTQRLASNKRLAGFSVFGFEGANGPGRIFIDDVVLLPVVEPLYGIQIRPAGAQQVAVTWTTNAAGFVLEATEAVRGSVWTTVTNAPGIFGDQFVVTLPTTGARRFFRLRK